MKRLLLCCVALCIVLAVNCLSIVGCGGINSTGGGTLLEGFYYILGRNGANQFTYSAYEIEPTSGTVSILGTGERVIAALTGWFAPNSFLGDYMLPTNDGHIIGTIFNSGVDSTALAFSVNFQSGANAGELTESSAQTIAFANLIAYYMRYDNGNFAICHDSSPANIAPFTEQVAYLSYSNGNFGSPVYSVINEGVGYQYYGGSVVLRGNMLYMVVISNPGNAVHILAYRVNGSGTLTLVRDIDLSGTIPALASPNQLAAYANVENNQYTAVIWDLTGPVNYFFVACNLDGSGTPTLAGIHDTGTFCNSSGPGKPIFANGFWYCAVPSLPSNNLDRISGFQVGAASVTQLADFPKVMDAAEPANTMAHCHFGFRNQIFYSSQSVGHYSMHSRVVAADGSVSEPTEADNTAIHSLPNNFDQFRLIRQGRMIVGLSGFSAPYQINLIRSTLTDGQMENYDNPAAPPNQDGPARTLIILK